MPVLNALASRRPVFVRALPVFAELWDALDGEENIHPYVATTDLVQALIHPPQWSELGASSGRPGDSARAACDIGRGLDEAIRGASYERMVRRLRTLPGREAPIALPLDTPAAFIARTTARKVEGLMLKALRMPGLVPLLRSGVRLVRRVCGRRRRSVTSRQAER